MPIAEAAKVLAQLYQQRDQIKETIFEITGLSDIMRGVSKASETATAQNIKSQFGSLRVNRRQREVQRFARDIIRMMTEIIAEHFQPQTIQEMTQQPLNPEVFRLMKSDQLRSYRIDVETDSTIAKQLLDDEESYAKLLAAIAQFVQGIAPMVAQGFIPLKVAMSLLQGGIRRFKLGRPVEEAFDEIDIEAAQKQQQEQQQQQGDPDAQAKAQELQLKTQEMEAQLRLAAQKLQLDAKGQEGKAQVDAAKLQLEREKATAQIQLEREKASATLNLERDKAVSGAESTERKNSSDLELRRELELGIPKEDFMAEIESKLTQVLQVFAQASTQQHSQLAEAIGKMSEAVEELAKPKKLIRDKSGKAIGAKTVDKI
jgi:hypothetical protein